MSTEEETMHIAVNAEVYCTDGFYGHATGIVLNPATEQVTHIAVQKDGLCSRTWLVPAAHLVDSTPDRVQLDLSTKAVESEMPPFVKTEFLAPDLPDTLYTTDLLWSHLIANLEMKTIQHENIPLDELAVHSGATVEARDGVIGHLEDFIVNPDDKHVSQIVIRAGSWYGHARLVFPVSLIDHFDADAIHLALNKSETEALATA
jgi:uncharacterized protein YrrD